MPFWPRGYLKEHDLFPRKDRVQEAKQEIGDVTAVGGFMHTGLRETGIVYEYGGGQGQGGGGKYWRYPYVWRAKSVYGGNYLD